MNSLSALNGGTTQHRLVILHQSLFTESFTTTQPNSLKVHLLLLWPDLLKECEFLFQVAHLLFLLLIVLVDFHA